MAQKQETPSQDQDDAPRPRVDASTPDGDTRTLRRIARRRAAGPSRGNIAANDDAPSIGGLIYALNQQPSQRPFIAAGIATAVWVVVGGLLGWSFLASAYETNRSIAAIALKPEAIAVATAVLLPIALFWFLAALIWRAQELRLMSSAMTEVAVRLAEPDRLAEQSVASLGQTVRRQVGAMNDAISRALGRAGELEALVHSEVAELERSYGENELRIRGLIDELASEREALGNNSERVSELLHGIGQRVSRDIVTASDQASRNLANATAQLSSEIERAGNQLNVTLQESSERTAYVVSERGNTLLSSLNVINERITKEVPGLLDRLGGEQTRLTRIVEGAGKNLAELETALATRTGSLEKQLGTRTRHLETVLTEYTAAVDQTMEQRTRTFHETLTNRLNEHVSKVEDSLKGRVEALSGQLSETRAQFESAFAKGSRTLDDSVSTKARALDAAIGEKMEMFDSSLSARAQDFYDTLENRGNEISKVIIERTRAVDDAFGDKARALRDALQAHGNMIRVSLEQQAAELDGNLVRGIDAVRRSSQEISQQSIATIEGLANQAGKLRDVSSSILAQIGDLTHRFESQSNAISKAAHSLETTNFRIDSTLETRHHELAQLLHTISQRAETFDSTMRGYSDNIGQSLTAVEQRAANAGEQLKRGTEQHSRAALEEMERLKNLTSGEAERTLSEFRNRFSTVSDEVKSNLADLTSKVSTSTDEVRERTARAATEFEETRARLIREAESIPDVARQSAGAMREALQEQLRALDTLSSFANRQSAARDVTPPPSGATGGSATRPTMPPAPALAKPASALSEKPSAPDPFGPRAGNPLTASLTQAINRPNAAQMSTAASALLGPSGSGLAGGLLIGSNGSNGLVSNPSTGGRGGDSAWSLGDLLARASSGDADDDDDRAAADVGAAGPLDIESIAAALDHETARGLWADVRKGQWRRPGPEVYTPRARRAFEQIQRRYMAEGSFRTTVDRYLIDFDRFLRDLSSKGTSDDNVQGYLVSDPGRVYLLLAHASGRLG